MQFKYSYPNLERVEENDMRFYKDSNNDLVPSVTTVLDATGDKSGITQWRRKVGPAQADAIVQESTLIGSAVHEAIENYLLGKSWSNFTEDRNGFLAKSISSKFISSCLNGIDEVWGLESGLILDGLYAGTADCIGVYKGLPAIIDFKTAKKLKRKNWIEDYFLQCSAYANAHNVTYGTNIKQIVVLMVDRNQEYKKFIVNNREFDHYTNKWKQRLIKFHNNGDK